VAPRKMSKPPPSGDGSPTLPEAHAGAIKVVDRLSGRDLHAAADHPQARACAPVPRRHRRAFEPRSGMGKAIGSRSLARSACEAPDKRFPKLPRTRRSVTLGGETSDDACDERRPRGCRPKNVAKDHGIGAGTIGAPHEHARRRGAS
jgi:hypothetical protein